ncbi:MAG TPA: Hpt domain-containing protein [Candidatus Bilophila faecipullorum]|uniref:Hpt domain-containing protein n=1 Tax=Candidatus Bilophila faecipullorum TaxID=2838482 RepID=A0A9D1R147_9BACT|nr:Hpt domain-containing protein [uncultured Bilophila sp.]HIW79776.1 Hpt domain-containing protein [Candidatus Bilophila faecipullorum]
MSDREEQGCRPISGVDWESGVKRLMGNEQLYRRLLSKFVSGYGDAGERVREALKAGERQKAHAELHTLKGVAGNLSLVPLADYVLAAEQAVKHDDVSHEGELIDAMDRELEALIRALKASGL